MYVWMLTCADNPAHRWVARRHGPHVFNRYLNGSDRVPSSSYGGVVVVGAGSSGVIVVLAAIAVAAAATVIMDLVVLVYRDGCWG